MLLADDRYKHQIAEQFGQAATVYNAQANLQREGAARLLDLMMAHAAKLPLGVILEIGCGTGFITQGLIQNFSQYSLEITDLSAEMLAFCQANVSISDDKTSPSFYTLDAERIKQFSRTCAAIVGGFVIQWFENPIQSLSQLISQLDSQGMLFISFPTCHSYPEWKHVCHQLNLPFTANPLPDPEVIAAALPPEARLCHAELIEHTTTHASAADFFREMKAIGAGVNQSQKRLTLRQMKTLLQHWDAQATQVQVHHQIAYWAIQRIA